MQVLEIVTNMLAAFSVICAVLTFWVGVWGFRFFAGLFMAALLVGSFAYPQAAFLCICVMLGFGILATALSYIHTDEETTWSYGIAAGTLTFIGILGAVMG